MTEENIYHPDVRERFESWTKLIEERCRNELIPLSKSVEVLLQLDDLKQGHCGYYLIDHGTRTQFWIDHPGSESSFNSSKSRVVKRCNDIINAIRHRACS